jgi:hypothetical protein
VSFAEAVAGAADSEIAALVGVVLLMICEADRIENQVIWHDAPPYLQRFGILPTSIFHFRVRDLKIGKISKWVLTCCACYRANSFVNKTLYPFKTTRKMSGKE